MAGRQRVGDAAKQHQAEIHHFLTLVRACLHVGAALSLLCCWKLYFLLLFFFYEWMRGGAMHLHHELYHMWEHRSALRCGKNLHATPEKPRLAFLPHASTPHSHSPTRTSSRVASAGLIWPALGLADANRPPHHHLLFPPFLSLSPLSHSYPPLHE